MPSDQPDFGTAVRFVNALIKTGITVHRATAPFTVDGKQYPANRYVVKTAQAFRPHVMDMFEPQDHPDDIPYPGAPPTAPYDNAGYTLAFQMGVQFDRILDGFDGPFEKLTDFAKVPGRRDHDRAAAPAGYYFTHQANDSFIVVNRLLAAGEDVSWLRERADGPRHVLRGREADDAGDSAEGGDGSRRELRGGGDGADRDDAAKLEKLRIGLFDTYGGGMPSGWTRLIFENFEFPYERVFPPDLDKGNLRAKYDVLVFNGAGLRRRRRAAVVAAVA